MAKNSSIEKALMAASLMGAVFMAVIAGAAVVFFKIPPAGMMSGIIGSVISSSSQEAPGKDAGDGGLWKEIRRSGAGVIRHDPSGAYQGYTLVTKAGLSGALLLDMDGKAVHKWEVPFNKAFANTPHLAHVVEDRRIFWRKAWLYPDGSVLGVYEADVPMLYGYGLVKADVNSNVLWSVKARIHDDVQVDAQGRIYILGQRVGTRLPSSLLFIKKPFIDGYILILSPEGKEIEGMSLMETIFNSAYLAEINKLKVDHQFNGDFFHANSLWIAPEGMKEKHGFLEEGHILVSFRNLGFLAVINPKERKVVWLQHGFWLNPSSARFTDSGTITLFDGKGAFLEHGRSRALEYDPQTMNIVWQWSGDGEEALLSPEDGRLQTLPNGNFLVSEPDGGRLIEVTRGKKVVWEYVNPDRKGQGAGEKIAILTSGERYSKDQAPFLETLAPVAAP